MCACARVCARARKCVQGVCRYVFGLFSMYVCVLVYGEHFYNFYKLFSNGPY
jgi:hypothetical protein